MLVLIRLLLQRAAVQSVVQEWLLERVMKAELTEQGRQMSQNELRETKGIAGERPCFVIPG